MKRKIFILLCVALLAVTGMTAFAQEAVGQFEKKNTMPAQQFVDVSQNEWFYDNVKTVFEYGVMTGSSAEYFDAKGTLTVAEALAIYCRLHRTYSGEEPISVSSSPWYQPYVDYANQTGFDFQENVDFGVAINRADFVMLLGAAFPSEALLAINDLSIYAVPDVSPAAYFYESMYMLYCAGVLSGSDAYGTFMPESFITRAEVAAIISRMIVPSLRKQITLEPVPFQPVPPEQLANRGSLTRKLTKSDFQEAYNIAAELVRPFAHYGRAEQLMGVTVVLRDMFENGMDYSMTEEHYNDVYGYFVKGMASCAGCTRATGLCLNILGIPYEHVNENQYSHQWCRVEIDGTYWICDAYGLYVGPEPAPYEHPYF